MATINKRKPPTSARPAKSSKATTNTRRMASCSECNYVWMTRTARLGRCPNNNCQHDLSAFYLEIEWQQA